MSIMEKVKLAKVVGNIIIKISAILGITTAIILLLVNGGSLSEATISTLTTLGFGTLGVVLGYTINKDKDKPKEPKGGEA